MAVEVSGVGDLLRELQRIAAGQKTEDAQRIYTAAAGQIAREARRQAPIGDHPAFTRRKADGSRGAAANPGALRRAIQSRGSSKRARDLFGAPAAYVSVNVRRGKNRAPHAHLVEFGSRNRAPKSGQLLAFLGSAGQQVFARRVADVAPNPFFARAVKAAGPRALAAAVRAHERLIAKLANQ
jgi:hypothetical protein